MNKVEKIIGAELAQPMTTAHTYLFRRSIADLTQTGGEEISFGILGYEEFYRTPVGIVQVLRRHSTDLTPQSFRENWVQMCVRNLLLASTHIDSRAYFLDTYYHLDTNSNSGKIEKRHILVSGEPRPKKELRKLWDEFDLTPKFFYTPNLFVERVISEPPLSVKNELQNYGLHILEASLGGMIRLEFVFLKGEKYNSVKVSKKERREVNGVLLGIDPDTDRIK